MLKYYKNVVLYNNNVDNGVAIVTGWKNPKIIQSGLDSDVLEKVVSIGPLYTKDGINFILANLFLNPQINHIVLLEDSDIDNSISDSILEFLNLIQLGEINFLEKFCFNDELLLEFRNYFKEHVSVVSRANLNDKIRNTKNFGLWRGSPLEVEAKKIDVSTNLASEKIGFMVRANTVKEAWMRSLKLIGTYGNRKLSDYDEEQLELMDLSIIIRNEDLSNPSMIDVLGITKEEIDTYADSLLLADKPDGIKYTYGNRFRDYEEVDQLEYLVTTLQEKLYSRRAVAVLWNPVIETHEEEVPCMNLYQAIVQDERLYMIAYIRANDVYNGFPRNIYGVLKIQDELCKRLNLDKGYVNTIAGSAHVYERNFGEMANYVKGDISFCEEDERGYFYIENNEDSIDVSFYSKEGVLQRNYQGKDATSLRDKCCFHISNLDHAFYLGQELAKAEIALEEEIPYIQDKKLVFKK